MFSSEEEYNKVMLDLANLILKYKKEGNMAFYSSDAWDSWNSTTHFYEKKEICSYCDGTGKEEITGWITKECPVCEGTGYQEDGISICIHCSGEGFITRYAEKEYIECQKCEGAGEWYECI